MRTLAIVVALALLTPLYSFPHANNQQEVMSFYEDASFKAILHLHYNHHFEDSPQFPDFQATLSELYTVNQDFMNVLFTDCDEDKQLSLYACQIMSKTKDNKYITGSVPSSDFKRLGKKLIQSPPSTRVLERTQEAFTYRVLQDFIDKLVPDFYRVLNNREEYEEFLLPRYSPKLVLFLREDEEIPLVLRKLAVAFFLRFDCGIVTDLNEQLLSLFKIKKYPKLAIIQFDFEAEEHVITYYQGHDYGEDSYHHIRAFLQKYALQEPRNDLVYHKIFMESSSQIHIAETPGQLEELKERLHGWSIIAKHPTQIPKKLLDLKQKYERFFSYIHYRVEPLAGKDLSIYYPSQAATYEIQEDMVFNSLNAEDFKSNMTVFMYKDFVVLGTREKYSYLCGIAQKPMFIENTRCLIIAEDQAHIVEQAMNIQFQYGIIVRLQRNETTKAKQSQGIKLTSKDYGLVYRDLQMATRMKMKEILDEFIENPMKQVEAKQLSLTQACFHPTKKCFLLFANLGKKDRTLQAYTKQVAINYLDSFVFYQVDIESNPELVGQLGIGDKADIVIYNPRTKEYSRLGKKVTKGLIEKFLKANLKNDKRLKKTILEDADVLTVTRRDTADVPLDTAYTNQDL